MQRRQQDAERNRGMSVGNENAYGSPNTTQNTSAIPTSPTRGGANAGVPSSSIPIPGTARPAQSIIHGAAAEALYGSSPPTSSSFSDGRNRLTRGGASPSAKYSSSIAPSNITGYQPAKSGVSTSPKSAGWYMTTGVLPAHAAPPSPEAENFYTPMGGGGGLWGSDATDLSRNASTSLGRKLSTKDPKYDSIYRATGLGGEASSPPRGAPQTGVTGLSRDTSAGSRFAPKTQPAAFTAPAPVYAAPTAGVPAVQYPDRGGYAAAVGTLPTTSASQAPQQEMYPTSGTAGQVSPNAGQREFPSAQSVTSPAQRVSTGAPVASALPINPVYHTRHRGERSDPVAARQEAINQREGFSTDDANLRDLRREGVPAFQEWSEVDDGNRVGVPQSPTRGDRRAGMILSPGTTGIHDDRDVQNPPVQSRFTEQMHMVGRQSEDSSVRPRGLAGLGHANSGQSLTAQTPSGHMSTPTIQEATPFDEGIATPRRADSGNPSQTRNTPHHVAAAAIPHEQHRLPENMGQDLPASEIAHQRDLAAREGAIEYPAQSSLRPDATGDDLPASQVREQRERMGVAEPAPTPLHETHDTHRNDPATSTAHAFPNVPPVVGSSPRGPRDMQSSGHQHEVPQIDSASRGAPQVEILRHQTQGPEQQMNRVEPPQVLAAKKSRWHDMPHPTSFSNDGPTQSGPVTSQSGSEPFGNVGSAIPPYMFVTYQAHVCDECVQSDRRLHSLKNHGQGWRYDYADPAGETPIPSDDPNTTKTGRREFTDSVSLLQPFGPMEGDGQQCQCQECLKKREMVKYAAENGLIEKIFEGRRHPASETITTTTYTTIVRAPIIEETVTTVKCQEPNCPECQELTEKHRQDELQDLVQNLFKGMVIHQTDGSDSYKDFSNIWGFADEDGNDGRTEDEKNLIRRKLDLLLQRAGNPRQEKMRGQTSTSEGTVMGGDHILDNTKGDDCDYCHPSESISD